MTKHNKTNLLVTDSIPFIVESMFDSMTSCSFGAPYFRDDIVIKKWWELDPFRMANFNFSEEMTYPVKNLYVLKDGTLKYEIAVTGFTKDELSVEIENNKLIVMATKKEGEGEENVAKTIIRSLSKRDFKYTTKISEKIDINKIDINVENGMMTILLPLKEEAKPISKKLL